MLNEDTLKFLNALFLPTDRVYLAGKHPATVNYLDTVANLQRPSAYICLNPVPTKWLATDIYPFRNFLLVF